jgi:hypothetical protein
MLLWNLGNAGHFHMVPTPNNSAGMDNEPLWMPWLNKLGFKSLRTCHYVLWWVGTNTSFRTCCLNLQHTAFWTPVFCCSQSTTQFKCPLQESVFLFRWEGCTFNGTMLFHSQIRWQGSGEDYITSNLMICTHHWILFGWSNREEWDGRCM